MPPSEIRLWRKEREEGGEEGIKTSFMDLSLAYNRAVNKRFIKGDNTDDNGM